MDQQLLPLEVRGGTISCSTGSKNVRITRSLHEGVTASAAPPPQLSSSVGQHPPDWAVEAQKGVWLDLCSPAAGAYVEVPLGEVSVCVCVTADAVLCAELDVNSSKVFFLFHNTCRCVAQPSWQQPA